MLICLLFFPFFLLFFTFANKTHLKGPPSLKLLPPAPNPSLLDVACGQSTALHSCRDKAKPPPHCPQPVLAAQPPGRGMPAPPPGIGRVPGTGAEQCRGAESRGRHASASRGTSWEKQRGRGRLFIAARAIIRSWCRGAGRLLAVQAQSEQWDGGLGAHGGMEGRAVPDRSCLTNWLAAL